jgi:cholesterol oxidase
MGRSDSPRRSQGTVSDRELSSASSWYGYANLLVCDGAAIAANVGVNPSRTITALAEHAMDRVSAMSGNRWPPGA